MLVWRGPRRLRNHVHGAEHEPAAEAGGGGGRLRQVAVVVERGTSV